MVLAIADSTELGCGCNIGANGDSGDVEGGEGDTPEDRDFRHLLREMEDVRERFPKALVHQILFFDYKKGGSLPVLPNGAIAVPPLEQSKTTTMKTVMCDLSSLLLAEMTSFAKSLQALYTIDSPSSSQNIITTNDWSSWASDSPGGLSRRNSQILPQAQAPHPGSPGVPVDRNHHRMSMPVHLPSSSPTYLGSAPGSQSASPQPSGNRGPPPTSFDQMSSAISGGPPANTVTRSSAASTQRDSSLERVSVQGFGSGSLSERARNKGKGRVGVVVGSLYLHAGRWVDAIREFVESATIARANSDHLWHAKALENILVSLLMLAWVGMDFQIPQVCYPVTEKVTSKSAQQTPSSSTTDVQSTRTIASANRFVSLQNLASLIPDLLNTILNLYNRAANFTGESLPQLPYSETVIRFSKLMAAVHLSNGKLDDDTLALLALNAHPRNKSKLTPSRVLISPTRIEITAMLFRALPPSAGSNLAIVDHTLILSGICSVLSSIGFHRKKALVMGELISVLIPGLVQARKLGAAEMGVHPAAGLAAWNVGGIGTGVLDPGEGDESCGVRELLGVLGDAYGVAGSILGQPSPTRRNAHHPSEVIQDSRVMETNHDDSNEAVMSRALNYGTLRTFGNLNLKMVALRSCISLCEALPDFRGIIRFTTELLRTAGSGVAPGPSGMEAIAGLSKEEQVRLATNISRTVGAAAKFGLKGMDAEYWDDFLVRGVELVEHPSWKAPVPHAKSELVAAGAIVEKAEKSPFIYNPFLKKPDAATVERLLIAGESAEFRVILQNPFDFDVVIERISLESDGVKFESEAVSVILGPYRAQVVSMEGTAWAAGPLRVTGCVAKVRDCRERRFPIFNAPWSAERDVKIKRIGLAAAKPPTERPISTTSKLKDQRPPGPKPAILELTVIKEQPVVVVESTSLSQSAIMILEGQTSSFTITLRNLSSTPVDLLLFSFQDSTAAQLQAAMSSKDISPAELYELELLFSHKQALCWRQKEQDVEPVILPNKTATFEIEILGKPGLASATVQVDYAHLGVPRREISDRFYTRQVVLPVTVTVNASVELVRVDILPFAGDFGWAKQGQRGDMSADKTGRMVEDNHHNTRDIKMRLKEQEEKAVETLRRRLGRTTDARDYCLLLLDVRNSWPQPLEIKLQVREPTPTSNSPMLTQSPSNNGVDEAIWEDAYTATDCLQPGHTSRLVLPFPRVVLQNPHAAIPTLNPANQRQFVVSASKVSPDIERASREAFWCREEILKLIRGSWEEGRTGRRGLIELRGIRLNPRMVDAVRIEDVGVEVFIRGRPESASVCQLGPSKFQVCTDELVTLATRIHNRTSQPIYPLLRLQPSLRNQPHNIALDLSKRFAHNGLLQRPLPLIQAGEVTEDEMGICMLCRGEFEIGVSIEETRIWQPADGENRSEGGDAGGLRGRGGGVTGVVPGGRARADTSALFMDSSVLGERQRRIWMGRENCVVIVKDRVDDRDDSSDDDDDG
jgi:trafficking protein particle complex subunit 9